MYTLTKSQLGPLAIGPQMLCTNPFQTLIDGICQGAFDITLTTPDLGGCSDRRPVKYSEASARPVVLGSGPLTTLIGYEFLKRPLQGSSLKARLVEVANLLKSVSGGQPGCVHTDESHLDVRGECGCKALNNIAAICQKMAGCANELFDADPELGQQVKELVELGITQRFVPESTTGALYRQLINSGFAQTILVDESTAPFGGIIFDEREQCFLSRAALYRASGFTFYVVHLGALRRMARALFALYDPLGYQFYLVTRAFNLAGLYLFCHPDTPTYTIS